MPIIMGPDTDKKSVAAAIVANIDKDGDIKDVPSEETGEDSLSEAERACAEDFSAALKTGNPTSIVATLRDLLDVLRDDGDKDEKRRSGFMGD